MSELTVSKTAIVTGGSRGIGRACVVALAKVGFDVVFSYASNAQAAEATIQAASAVGQKVQAVQADAANVADAQKLIDAVMALHGPDGGRVDVVVNNAGITRDGLMMRLKDEDWDAVIQTNLTGTFYLCRAAAKVMMKQRSGKIINISSVVAIYGNGGQSNYCASKAGVIGLTKSMAKELGARNIQVNAITPGFIATDMTENLPADKLAERIPLGRLGQPEDIAEAVVFLAASGSYITGQVLGVDGGLVI
jgi:3-oxoacyl-[acyl-carrier protein] reductase